MKNFVFISYSSNDKPIADALCHYLEENSIPCWIAPRDILPGQTWAGSIIKAIKNCSVMVLIYSQNSNSSHQVANEIDKAFSNNKPIIPFMLDCTPMNEDYEYYLSRKHWLEAYPEYKSKFPDLLKAVSALISPIHIEAEKQEDHGNGEYNIITDDTPISSSDEVSAPTKTTKNFDESKSSALNTSQDIHNFSPQWSPEATDEEKEAILNILRNMVYVEGGTKLLGATEEQLKWAKSDEKPTHTVELSSFWMNKFTVTQDEWTAIMKSNPSKYRGTKLPVERVSLIDCRMFVKRLIELSNINFALPTESQWEYAARGGVKSEGYIYSGSNVLKEVGWGFWNGDNCTQTVGLKKSNELGLFDMSGNVAEWCDEVKGKYHRELIKNPHNHYKPKFWNENSYIYRGGDFLSTKKCRVAYRASATADNKSDTRGLRLVINIIDKI